MRKLGERLKRCSPSVHAVFGDFSDIYVLGLKNFSRLPLHADNRGKFQLIELDRSMVVLGVRFDASLDDIETYLTRKDS